MRAGTPSFSTIGKRGRTTSPNGKESSGGIPSCLAKSARLIASSIRRKKRQTKLRYQIFGVYRGCFRNFRPCRTTKQKGEPLEFKRTHRERTSTPDAHRVEFSPGSYQISFSRRIPSEQQSALMLIRLFSSGSHVSRARRELPLDPSAVSDIKSI